MQDEAGRRGLQQRLFAALYPKSTSSENTPVTEAHKREIFAGLQGDVMEIGPGKGDNLAYLGEVTHWIGIEPNLYMQDALRAALSQAHIEGEIHTGTAENTHLPDASFDAVISSFVLCSVTDLDAALAEILRVLRPGGRFAFMEHVAAPQGTLLRRSQRFIRPLWQLMADGCHPDREIEAAIRRAGFASVEVQTFRVPEPIVSPRIAGVAVKSED
jgi:SAM-dependent methyltransferase